MPIRNSPERWGSISIALHWITALAVLGLVAVGYVMVDLPPGRTKIDVYNLHKSIGLTVLALTLLRLGWRLAQPAPQLPEGMPGWQAWAARLGHLGLYGLLLLIPASGWVYNWASNFPTRWFGLTVLASPGQVDAGLKALSKEVHEWGVIALILLLLAHAGAAFYHHYQLKDAVLRRMAPWIKSAG